MYLSPVYNTTNKSEKWVIINYKSLLDSVEKPLNINKVKVEELYKILGEPLEIYVKKTLNIPLDSIEIVVIKLLVLCIQEAISIRGLVDYLEEY